MTPAMQAAKDRLKNAATIEEYDDAATALLALEAQEKEQSQ